MVDVNLLQRKSGTSEQSPGGIDNYRSITVAAVLIGILSVAASLYISFTAYKRSLKDMEKRYRSFYLKIAHMIAADISSHHSDDDATLLNKVSREWNRVKNRPDDEYLCIVDKSDRLILHTSHPNTTGNQVGKNKLVDENNRLICTLHDIGEKKTDYIGRYISSSGHEQLAAFAIEPRREWLIGVHRSQVSLNKEVASGLKHLLIGSMVIFGLLIPLSIFILYLTFLKTQKRRRQTEEALRKNEEDLKITLDSIGDGVIAVDENGRVTGMNPIAESLTGFPVHEAINRPVSEIFIVKYSQNSEPGNNPFITVLAKGKTLELPDNTTLLANDRREYTINATCTPKKNTEGKIIGAVLVFRDITEKITMEEKFLQSQKMESIGLLAGGVAHDFNNMLGCIVGYAEALSFKLEDHPELFRYIDGIIDTSKRGADLTGKLLAFSRKTTYITRVFDIHVMIREIVAILERSIDKRINVTCRLNAVLSNVKGDPSLLQNALLNLAINARDAMPNGGSLAFETKNADLSETFCKNSAFDISPGAYLVITLSDTGTGMDKNTLRHIFDPFFTTKDIGKGTGLGLSAVYGTIVEHKGCLDVFSEPGKGTKFTLYLPVSREKIEKPAPVEKISFKGSGCVLLVDDELMIRSMGYELLESLGFDVLLASDGREGLKIFNENREKVKLVILDIMMPNLNGIECFEEIIKIKPDATVLLSSGFSHVPDVSNLLDIGLKGFIHKPFTLSELTRIIEKIFNGQTTPPVE